MNVSSVRERVVLWIAAAIAGAVVIGGVVHLVLIAVTTGRPDVPVAPWVVVFAEDRGAATLVGQEVLAEASGAGWVDAFVIGVDIVDVVMVVVIADVVMVVVIAGIVALLCAGLAKGAPFTRLLARAMGAAGIVIVVGSFVAQTLQAIAHSVLVAQLAATEGGAVIGTPAFGLDYDLLPVAGGLVLGLLATAFARAVRLQVDSTGLV